MGHAEQGGVKFLIIGTARSGTTLVQRLCAELPDVWVPPETHFWDLADRARHRFDFPLRARDRTEFAHWLLTELRHRDLGIEPGAVAARLQSSSVRIGLWQVFDALVAAMSPDVAILGEKTPNHIAWWEHFASARPDLRFIAVVRDPRAVLRSQRTVAWGEPDPWALAERWLAHQRSIRDCERLLGSDRCLVVRYEDLVADTPGHHERIAAFLDVPFEPAELTDATLAAHPLFPARESWKDNATDRVTTDRVNTWKETLSELDIAAVQTTCHVEMDHFGYALEDAAPAGAPPGESKERVAAFRHWYQSVAAVDPLPIN